MFDGMAERDVVSWTALMSGYSGAGRPRLRLAVSLFHDMCHRGVPPNAFTFSTAVSARARLADAGLGRKVHARAEVERYASDTVVATVLIDMYGKAGNVKSARAVFDGMAALARNAVSRGSMLSVYAQNVLGCEAIQFFAEFRTESNFMAPNYFMLSSVVNACAGIGRLGVGKSARNSPLVWAWMQWLGCCGFV